jgi:hypothetical protein
MKNNITIAFTLLLFMFAAACNNARKKQPETNVPEQVTREPNIQEQEEPTEKPSVSNVFTPLNYDSAVAYYYEGTNGHPIVDANGKIAEKIKKFYVLDRDQATRLTNILCDPLTYGGHKKDCFDPHFGVVFFKKGATAAFVTVSLECNYLTSSEEIPGSGGFSDKGTQEISDFEKELKIFY